MGYLCIQTIKAVFLNVRRGKIVVGRGGWRHYEPILGGMQNENALVHNVHNQTDW